MKDSMTRPTPRTDEALSDVCVNGAGYEVIPVDFARTLERDLTEANEISCKYEERYFSSRLELAEAKEKIKKLEKAGDDLAKLLSFTTGDNEDEEWVCSLRHIQLDRCYKAINNWTEAKA